MSRQNKHKPLLGFEDSIVKVPLDDILPRYFVGKQARSKRKYQTILKSLEETGLVEPLVVCKHDGQGKYMLLDGHWRFYALKELGVEDVECLVSLSDESFSYNHYVNRLSVIQEQRMILKAIEKGVSEEDIARALNVDIKSIMSRKNLLNGLSGTTIDMLKDVRISQSSLKELKKVVPRRQQEIAEMMLGVNTFTYSYVRALVSSTDKVDMVKKGKRSPRVLPHKMELEVKTLEREFMQIEADYGSNVCDLTLAVSYLKQLLGNVEMVRFLGQNYHDIYTKFEELVQMEAL